MNKFSSRAVSLVATALLTAACAGPRTPLEVSVREFPTDVLLGKKSPPPPPPLPGANLNPGFPSLIQPPPFTVNTRTGEITKPPPTPVLECPTAHPFTGPVHPAFSTATKPPVPGEYVFRNTGTVGNLGGRQRPGGALPAQTRRTIKNVDGDSSEFLFDIEEPVGDRKYTTRIRVVTENRLPSTAGNDGTAGIFLVRHVTDYPDLTVDEFAPNPEIKLLEFPAEPGREWDSSGADPLRQTTMRFHARIGIDVPDGDDPDDLPDRQAKARVDACGAVLDAWYVEILNGEILAPNVNRTFKALYAFAPQFGGFSVMDIIETSGIDRGDTIASKNTATISSEPAFPGQ